MARKVIDIIYNLVRRRLAQSGAYDRGSGITSLPNSMDVEIGMKQIFKQLKDGGLNPASADKIIKNEDDLLRVIEEINQKKMADIKRRQDAAEGIETVLDKMNRGIPLNPGDQAKIEGAGMKTKLDAFQGFQPKVITGGKTLDMSQYSNKMLNDLAEEGNKLQNELAQLDQTGGTKLPYREFQKKSRRLDEINEIITEAQKMPEDYFPDDLPKIPKNAKKDMLDSYKNLFLKGEDTKYDADVLATDLAERRGFIKEGQDSTDMDPKKYTDLYSEAYNFLTELRFLNKPPRKPKAKGGLMSAVKNLQKKFGKDIIQKGKAPKRNKKKKLQDMFREFNKRTSKANGGVAGTGQAIKESLEAFKRYQEAGGKLSYKDFIALGNEGVSRFFKGGGIAHMLGEPREEMAAGGQALRRLLQFLHMPEKASKGLQKMKLPKQMKFFAERQGFDPDQIRIDYLEQVLETLKKDRDLIKGMEPRPGQMDIERQANELFRKTYIDETQGGRFEGLSSEMIDSSILELETILKNLKTKGRKLNADGGRIGFADGGISRRKFLKIMAALAAFPLVGKLAKTTKIAKTAKPIITPTSEMPEHFPKLVEKIIREGQVVKKDFVKKTGDVTTYKHPDRPDIELTIEGDGNRIQLDFDTDQGMKGGYEFRKGVADEVNPRPPNDFEAGEVKYRMSQDGETYTKDFELGIDTGTENLDEFAGIGKQKTSKSKVNLPESGDDFADGGLAGLLGE